VDIQRDQSALVRFINHEATAGLLLVIAAAAALVFTNAGFADQYEQFLALPVSVQIGPIGLDKTLIHWVNDGLMAVFFFLVGLEIKREVLDGNLSSRDQIVLPAMAAVGGMVAPALFYSYFNWGTNSINGWAIPAATDIAFALGALALAGSRVPLSLKVFLLTLATLDDLGAIVIIAMFYTANLSVAGFGLAAIALVFLIGLNYLRVDRTAPYVFFGVAMWIFVLKSGVHATLARSSVTSRRLMMTLASSLDTLLKLTLNTRRLPPGVRMGRSTLLGKMRLFSCLSTAT
jgi:NhaA family Na+:H+ antiporter